LEVWFRPTVAPGTGNYTGLLDREDSSVGAIRDGYNMLIVESVAGNTLITSERFAGGVQAGAGASAPTGLIVGVWNHFIYTYDGLSSAAYYNGVYQGFAGTTTTTIKNNIKTLTIGVRGGQLFRGDIGQVRIYNRALTATEALGNFNAHASRYNVNTTPIVATNIAVNFDAAAYGNTGTITDRSGNNNNGTIQGTTTAISTLFTPPALYPYGGYWPMNGTNNYISTTFNYPSINSTTFSLCGWFRTTVASGTKIVGFEGAQLTSGSYDKQVYVDTSGYLVGGVYNGATRTIQSTSVVNDGRWHNFAFIHIASVGIELWVDGVRQGTTPHVSGDSTTWLKIGGIATSGWPGGVTGYFTGDIGQIIMYTRQLSLAEIQQNFAAYRTRFGV
jgi:hypothetical protein